MNLQNIAQNYQNTVGGVGINVAFFDGKKWENYSSGTIDGNIPTSPKIWYDSASLTKTFTATLLLDILRREPNISLETSAVRFLPFLQNFESLTLRDLLTHRSGFQIIEEYDKSQEYVKTEIEQLLFSVKNLKINPITKPQYSDLNYLFLGQIVEVILGTNLQSAMIDFCKRFAILNATFLPLNNGILESEIAPSQHGILPGKPQDEKARWLGGACGHAGLFTTLNGLQNWSQAWLENRFEFDLKTICDSYAKAGWKPGDSSDFGLVWRSGLLSKFPNHAGFAGCSIILNHEKHTAFVQTSNHNFPYRSEEKRQNWISWHQRIKH